jgi:hypothetical protein
MSYHDLLAQVAIRVNALTGVQAAALEATYILRPLTGAQFKSSVFPFSAVKDALLLAEAKLATVIAETGNHPWRAFLKSQTAELVHRAFLPKLDALAGAPIIGVWGSVVDSADGKPCTEQPIELIERRVENAGGFWTREYYHFNFRGDRIYHTRPAVKMEVCVYDRTLQIGRVDNNDPILLPDALEEAYIAGALGYLVRDDEFVEQAAGYRALFNDTLASIKQGLTSVPPASAPAGSLKEAEG